MSHKKPASSQMQTTLNDLNTAIERWDNIDDQAETEPQSGQDLPEEAQSLLQELRDQIHGFDKVPAPCKEDP